MVVLPSTLADMILYHCFSVGYYTNEIDPSYNSHNWNFRAAFVEGLIGKNRELPVQAETRDLMCVVVLASILELQQILLK